MEIIVGALMVYGLIIACREAGKAAGQGVGSARKSAASKSSGQPKAHMADNRRRATTGWWVNEARRGFPVTLGGFRHGWRDHSAQAAQTKADAHEHKLSVREAIGQHTKRIEQARQQQGQTDDGRPPGDRLPADQIKTRTQTGDHEMPCTNPDCECHKGKQSNSSGGGQPAAPGQATNGQSANGSAGGTMTTSTTTGDTDYEGAQNVLDQIKSLADSIDIAAPLGEGRQLADGLPSMIPDDSETPSHVADAVSHLEQAEMHRQAAAESATAGKATLEQNFGAQHEAVQATGHDAERGFHGVR
jgi:hypothetical protein